MGGAPRAGARVAYPCLFPLLWVTWGFPSPRGPLPPTSWCRDRQRTACNTEAKYLMLSHAFDVLGCIRVELKTDALNQQSRAAILRIGATEEGILRAHMITATGRVRDSVMYSILDREWPDVRARLEARLR